MRAKTKIGIIIIIAIISLVAALSGCTLWPSEKSTDDIPVVKNFEAERYMGVWHEIARLPQRFERGLTDVTATYSLENGRLIVVNRGIKAGEEVVATAVGDFAGPKDEGAFRISFFRPFYGDYKIIYLSSAYDLAMVTSSDRSSLWILAREKLIPLERLLSLLEKARIWGFDLTKLEYP